MNEFRENILPDQIEGVVLKELKSHGDERGFFREIIRHNDPFFENSQFGQWSHSKMARNVVKAWHYHHVQTDWWYVPLGALEVALFDNREESPTYQQKMTFKLGEKTRDQNALEACVQIPPGVLHGCKVLTSEAHLFYITSQVYDPNEEGRIPYNSELVPHHWGTGVIVAENDKRTFIPRATRIKLSS